MILMNEFIKLMILLIISQYILVFKEIMYILLQLNSKHNSLSKIIERKNLINIELKLRNKNQVQVKMLKLLNSQ
jgi:hypothetical protein